MWLHTDAGLMPKDRALWASWNFLRSADADDDSAVCVSYWANRLQVGKQTVSLSLFCEDLIPFKWIDPCSGMCSPRPAMPHPLYCVCCA